MSILDPIPLTDAEREDRDRLLAKAEAALGREVSAMTEFGRTLGEILNRGLYREAPGTGATRTVEEFARGEYGHPASWIYDRVWFAEVNDDLASVGAEPVTALYQAALVVQVRHDDPATRAAFRAKAVAFARARAKGVRATADDFEAARDEFVPRGATTPPDGDGTRRAHEADRQAAREHGGLLVAVPATGDRPDALARLPGLDLVPYDGMPPDAGGGRAVDAVPFTRSALDEVAEHVWSAVAPDPWVAPSAWTLGETGAVTLFPDRLSSPRSRPKAEPTGRGRTVIVAPGVDLLHPNLPADAARAVVSAAGADRARLYLLMTGHPDRAWEGWPPNVWVVAEADGTAAAVAQATDALRGCPAPAALFVRDLREPVEADLEGVGWVLARGARTTQRAYDSLRAATGDRVDRGSDVKARHSFYPNGLPFSALSPRALAKRPGEVALRTAAP